MSRLLKISDTTKVILFLMVDSDDHVTGKTGLTPTVTLAKNGAAFASAAGTVAELSSGWYKLTPTSADTGTLGPLAVHASASGADPVDLEYQVVAYDPYDSVRQGMTALPNAAADAAGGLPVSDAGGLDLDATVGKLVFDVNGNVKSAVQTLATAALALFVTQDTGKTSEDLDDGSVAALARGAAAASKTDIAQAVWDVLLTAMTTDGSIGKLLGSIDVDVNGNVKSAVQTLATAALALFVTQDTGKTSEDLDDGSVAALAGAVAAGGTIGGVDADKRARILLAVAAGVTSLVDNGDATKTLTFYDPGVDLDDDPDAVCSWTFNASGEHIATEVLI